MSAIEIDDTMTVSRHHEMIAADIGDEAVILNVQNGYFFQLNRTAALIWGALETPVSVGTLCTKIADAHSVDPATCRQDVIAFIADMHDREIVTIA